MDNRGQLKVSTKNSMDAHRRVEISLRRKDISCLYIKGLNQYEIATKVGVSQKTVSYDLKQVRQGWIKDAIMDFDKRQGQELARIDLIELESWDQWEKSKTRTRKRTTTKPIIDDDGKPKILREEWIETLEPDGRWLDRVKGCVQERCKILGLYAPEVMDIGGDLAKAFDRLARREKENDEDIDIPTVDKEQQRNETILKDDIIEHDDVAGSDEGEGEPG